MTEAGPPATRSLLYVLRDYPTLSQTFVRNEVTTLRARGNEVHVVALREQATDHVPAGWGGQREVARRVPRWTGLRDLLHLTARHPGRAAALWRAVRATGQRERWTALYLVPGLAARFEDRGFATCHTHFAFENAYPALYLARALGIPASITVHAADIYRDPAASVALLQHFDTVVTVCGYNVDVLRRAGLDRPRLLVVPCGVEVPPVPTAAPGSPASDRPTVVSVGRFVPKKGFDVLVTAWATVVREVPGARLVLVGDGPGRAAVEALVGSLDLGGSVEFHGARPNSEVLRTIAGGDVFTLACVVPPDGDSDALPVVLREAMARARPVVTTAVAGVPEALDETCGWIVPPSDPDALAVALLAALADPAGARTRGLAGRQRVERTATLDVAAAAFEAFVDSPSTPSSTSSPPPARTVDAQETR